MKASPRRVNLAFTHEGQEFILVFDMETIARFEEATDLSIFDAVAGLVPGKSPKLSVMGSLLQAALAEHHPDLTRADAMTLLTVPKVQALFAEGIASAMPQAADTDPDSAEDGDTPPVNPPKAASKRGSAGKTT